MPAVRAGGVVRQFVETMRRRSSGWNRGVGASGPSNDASSRFENSIEKSSASSAASFARISRSQLKPTSEVRLSATASARPSGLSRSTSVRCTTTSLRPSVLTTTASVKPMSMQASWVVFPAMIFPLRSTRIERPAP